MTELVPIPSPGVSLHYGETGLPLVVLLHDWFGRLPWLDSYATAMAARGFRVVVPDFYRGVATVDEETAGSLQRRLDLKSSLATIDEVIDEARSQGSRRVATVGFSLGGWLALLHAQGGAADAVVAYYASLDPENHGVIPCPVLLHLAETDDEWADGEEPEAFVARLAEHGTPVIQHTYPGTRHSFANATVPSLVEPRAAALAFARTAVFLQAHLTE